MGGGAHAAAGALPARGAQPRAPGGGDARRRLQQLPRGVLALLLWRRRLGGAHRKRLLHLRAGRAAHVTALGGREVNSTATRPSSGRGAPGSLSAPGTGRPITVPPAG